MGGEESMDLDQIIQEGMHQFTGQDSAMEMKSPDAAQPGGEEGGTQDKGTEGQEKTEAEKQAEAQAEAARAQQEADRVKGLEDENKALKGRMDAIDTAKAEEQASAEFGKKVFDFSREQNARALAAIDKLDPDEFKTNDEYQTKVAEIWATKDEAVARFTRAIGSEPPAAAAAGAAAGTDAGERPGTAAPGKDTPAGGAKTAQPAAGAKPAWNDVASAAQAQGLKPDDPDFLSYCRQAPQTGADGKPIPFAEQVQWAIAETKELKALKELKRQGKELTAADVAAHMQANDQPMGRGAGIVPNVGGGPAGKKETTKPVSLDDALGFAQERRTL